MKLLESASGRGAASSSKEPSHVQKRESFTGRGTARSSFSETSTSVGPSRESSYAHGIPSYVSETSIREPEQHAPPGRMRYNPSISEK